MVSYFKFTKDHVAGFGKGHVLATTPKHSAILIQSKHGEEVGENEYLEFQNKAASHMKDYVDKVKAKSEKLIKDKKAELGKE